MRNNITENTDYKKFNDAVNSLKLTVCASELHGILCGYICAGDKNSCERYITSQLGSSAKEKSDDVTTLYSVFNESFTQLASFDFSFHLMLPDDEEQLPKRAQALADWCDGFTHSLVLSGISADKLQDEDTKESLIHITEFSELDCESVKADSKQAELSFIEICEYTRLAVLNMYTELHPTPNHNTETKH